MRVAWLRCDEDTAEIALAIRAMARGKSHNCEYYQEVCQDIPWALLTHSCPYRDLPVLDVCNNTTEAEAVMCNLHAFMLAR